MVVPSVRSKCGGVCFEGMGEVVGGRRRQAVVGQSRRWAWWWSRQRRRAWTDDDGEATFWWPGLDTQTRSTEGLARALLLFGVGKGGSV